MVGVGGEVEVEREGVDYKEREQNFQRFAVHVLMRFSSLSSSQVCPFCCFLVNAEL